MTQQEPSIVPSVVATDRVKLESAEALSAVTREEIDMQISTAKRYPRDVAKFKEDVLAMATMDQETAGECLYALPRAGGNITGPSVRLAEMCLASWGNVRVGTRIIGIGDNFVTAQAAIHDVEKNIQYTKEVMRPIRDRRGRRFNDDMIRITSMAAQSIALRDAVFRIVPKGILKKVEKAVRKVIAGTEETLDDRRKKALDYFKNQGITPDRVFARLNVAGLESITLNHMVVLRGAITAVQDGTSTWEEQFPPPGAMRDDSRLDIKSAVEGALKKSEEKEARPKAKKPPKEEKPAAPSPKDKDSLVDEAVKLIAKMNEAGQDIKLTRENLSSYKEAELEHLVADLAGEVENLKK